MDIQFDGQTAIVTGGARGIGYACAQRMLESGARVALVGRSPAALGEAVERLTPKGPVRGYGLDISKVATIPEVVSRIRKEMGPISVLIQAAGILQAEPAEQITPQAWDGVLNTNSKGLFFMMQAVCDQSMIPRRSGAIVNLASIAGIRGMRPPLCAAHYSASKGAVVQLTRQAAVEWAKYHIRANAVAPGGVKTEGFMTLPAEVRAVAADPIPLKRLSEPGDIANAVCFLASEAASMITGHILVVDGGGSVVGV